MAATVALVTGASSGIGDATARRLAELGYTVYGAARRTDRMAGLADLGIRVQPVDVTDDESMVALVAEIVADHGRVDVLVNNAGYGSYGAVEDVPMEEARRQFEVNVFGLARLTQLVLPHMRAQRSGYIVNISSIGGKMWEPLGGWYHAAKFAVEGLSDSLRAELAPFGIHVVVIEPGAIKTEWAGISADNLQASSAGTAYADQATLVAGALRAADKSRLTSEPGVVAEAIAKVVQQSRPRTRYAVGGGARSILFVQRILTDRGFDRFIRLAYRAAG
jgi:NAD(P)-dependent dehydrogenase (short-subunit alcohol dehydrogenase family)